MYKHSACSSVITPSFSSSFSLSHSIHFPHMFLPSLPPLSPPPSSILTPCSWPYPVKICMQSDEITQAYTCARRTHPPLIWIWISHSHHSDTRTHVCAYSTFKTQTYFPINNACWSYCCQRSRENERVAERREMVHIVSQSWKFQFASEMKLGCSSKAMTLFILITKEGSNETTWLIVIPPRSLGGLGFF